MSTLNEMTTIEFTQLLDDYFAPPVKRSKMTEEEIKDLAERVNRKVNIPMITERREERILIKIIIKIDRFLYDNLPNELYEMIRSLDRGIDDAEAKRLIKRLSELANKYINIPYIPEQAEYIAIRFVIGIIINAARKHWDLSKSKEVMESVSVPETKSLSDSEIEALIPES